MKFLYQSIIRTYLNYYLVMSWSIFGIFLNHKNVYKDGLILPHSSFLSYLLFFGVIGLLLLLLILGRFLFLNKDNFFGILLLMYFLINFIKSDSLIYFPNFVLFFVIVHLIKFKKFTEVSKFE